MVVPVSPTRRGALALLCGGALLLVTGCDWPDEASDGAPTSTPDPDLGVMETTGATLADLELLLAATLAAHPGLNGSLSAWQALHEEHRRVLASASGQEPSASPGDRGGPTVPARAPRAWVGVRDAEGAYAASLATSAGLVRSGPFARLLAVMSAGVRQQLAADTGGAS